MADRVGVIDKGELILVEEKTAPMKKLGNKSLTVVLAEPLAAVPPELAEWRVALKADGHENENLFDTQRSGERGGRKGRDSTWRSRWAPVHSIKKKKKKTETKK